MTQRVTVCLKYVASAGGALTVKENFLFHILIIKNELENAQKSQQHYKSVRIIDLILPRNCWYSKKKTKKLILYIYIKAPNHRVTIMFFQVEELPNENNISRSKWFFRNIVNILWVKFSSFFRG